MKKSWINRNVLGFGLTSLFNDASYEMTEAILPAFVEQLIGISSAPFVLGLISGTSNFISSIMKILSGFITDKVNKYKPILIFGFAITPLASGLIGTAKYLWQIIFYKAIGWMGKGIREPMRDTWLSKIVSSQHYGQAFGFVRALDTIGGIIGPLIAYFSLKFFKLEQIFFIAFIPGLLSVLSFILLTKEEKTIHKTTSQYVNWKTQLKKLPKNFNYFILIMLLFKIGNFNKMLIIYRAQEILSGQTSSYIVATGWAILLYTFFNISRAISEYCIGTLSDYLNRKNLLAIFGFGLFGISSLLQINPSPSTFIWILIFLFAGISFGTVISLEKSYCAQLLPDNVRGTGFGILQTIDGIGHLVSNLIVGSLWSTISPKFGFLYAAVLSICSMILLIFFKD